MNKDPRPSTSYSPDSRRDKAFKIGGGILLGTLALFSVSERMGTHTDGDPTGVAVTSGDTTYDIVAETCTDPATNHEASVYESIVMRAGEVVLDKSDIQPGDTVQVNCNIQNDFVPFNGK